MKYTIEGFSQKRLIESGMDCADVVFLRWFIDWIATGTMKTMMRSEKEFYWIQYDRVLQELPIIGVSSKDALARRLKAMESKNALESATRKDETGTWSYWRPAPVIAEWISSSDPPSDSKVGPPPTLLSDPSYFKVGPVLPKSRTKDSSTRDSSTRKIKDPAPAKAVTDLFWALFQEKTGSKPVWKVQYAGFAAKLSNLDVGTVRGAMKVYFDDPWNRKIGYDFGAFYQNINRLLSRVTMKEPKAKRWECPNCGAIDESNSIECLVCHLAKKEVGGVSAK